MAETPPELLRCCLIELFGEIVVESLWDVSSAAMGTW